ncbi:glycosyltransferase [Apibacter adventoris]|uniref:glycosyltransferase n=1 Tax=Apibacter adventoris TaxID=1679466 RepID=UPI001FE3C388|nr:glycosyltransferase [Apibacter adventoris]
MQKKKIKVLFRLRSMEMGGVQKVILDLLNNLSKDKFEFTLLLNLYQGELRNDIPKNVKLLYLTKGKEDFSKNPLLKKIQLAFRLLKLYLYKKFPSFQLKEKYDIEVASSYSEYDMTLNSSNKNSKKIAWFHSEVTYERLRSKSWDYIKKMKKFDYVVFCANQIRNLIEEKYGITFSNSSVIYNAVHVDEIKKKAEEYNVDYGKLKKPIFCSIGRLHSRKGYEILVNVHARLINENYIHSIVIVGDGEEMDRLKKQVIALKVEKTFKLLGTKLNPYPYLKAADYFVLPTKSEAYPLVINEALALEKPIISTRVGGIPEMIDNNINGLLVNCNEEEIYQGMKKFIQNSKFVDDIKRNLEKPEEKFNPDSIYQEVEELLLQLLN